MGTYNVKPKDTLWDIANNNNTTVSNILAANPSITNPNLIYSGQKITIPGLTNDNTSTGNTTSNTNTNSSYEYKPFQKSADLVATEAKSATINELLSDYYNKGYTFTKQGEYDTLYGNYADFVKNGFSYDFNADALYQQYKDKYIKQGKMAMQDTMGQAAALTGGYGNSYASTAGNQAYQASLENLNDVIPQLYQMAYDMHNQKGQNMLNQLGILDNERTFEYGTWVDKGNMLNNDRTFWQTEANNLYGREYDEHTASEGMRYQTIRDAVADGQFKDQMDFEKEKFDWQKKNSTVDNTTIDDPNGNYYDDEGDEDEDGDGSPQPYTKGYYDGWTKDDWYSYFEELRLGTNAAEAVADLNKLLAAGCIPQEYVDIASRAARGGLTSGVRRGSR